MRRRDFARVLPAAFLGIGMLQIGLPPKPKRFPHDILLDLIARTALDTERIVFSMKKGILPTPSQDVQWFKNQLEYYDSAVLVVQQLGKDPYDPQFWGYVNEYHRKRKTDTRAFAPQGNENALVKHLLDAT